MAGNQSDGYKIISNVASLSLQNNSGLTAAPAAANGYVLLTSTSAPKTPEKRKLDENKTPNPKKVYSDDGAVRPDTTVRKALGLKKEDYKTQLDKVVKENTPTALLIAKQSTLINKELLKEINSTLFGYFSVKFGGKFREETTARTLDKVTFKHDNITSNLDRIFNLVNEDILQHQQGNLSKQNFRDNLLTAYMLIYRTHPFYDVNTRSLDILFKTIFEKHLPDEQFKSAHDLGSNNQKTHNEATVKSFKAISDSDIENVSSLSSFALREKVKPFIDFQSSTKKPVARGLF